MKRILCLLCILTCLLTACAAGVKPAGMSQDCYDLGRKALDAVDAFLDGNVSAVAAAGQVQDFCQRLSALPTDQADGVQSVVSSCEQIGYMLVRAANGDKYAAKEVETARNNLARTLGEGEY